MQDALDSYEKEIVVELTGDTTEQMENNVDRIVSWVELWQDQHHSGVTNELDEQESGSESDE